MHTPEHSTKIEKTDESDIVDVEDLDDHDDEEVVTPTLELPKLEKVKCEINQQIEVQLRDSPIKKDDGLSTSVPNQRTLWPHEHTPPISRGSLSDMLASNFRRDHHSMSNSSTMRQKEETIAMIRGSNSCSKDTLLFIDQQNHSLMEDDYLSNRSLWVRICTHFYILAEYLFVERIDGCQQILYGLGNST